MKSLCSILILFFLSGGLVFAQDDPSQEMTDEEYQALIDTIEAGFVYQTGTVDLGEGLASLNVPIGYKFIDQEQSEYVLTTLWGNPPSVVLGMLFLEDQSPVSDNLTYAVEISYSDEGYISDKDAKKINYNKMMKDIKASAEEENQMRIAEGYQPVEIIGWASEPFYDEVNNKLHWAKEIKFGDDELNTLNYNIRILGRRGYLTMNAIGDMDALPGFQNDIDNILASVDFNAGNTYSEFNPDIDKVAMYGIGGLVAGKVLAKAGFFVLLAKFWKIIAIGAIGLFAGLKKFVFGKKDKNTAPSEHV